MQLNKEDWHIVRFGELVHQGKDTVVAETSGLERFIAGEHMNSEDLHLRQWGNVGEGYLGPAFHRFFEKGDILYGSRRTYLKKVAVADFDGITANTTYIVRAKSEVVVPELVPFLMLSDGFTAHSVKKSKGSVNPYINFKDITDYEFRLPPREQQERLAELLWAADEVGERYLVLLDNISAAQKRYSLDFYQDDSQELVSFASFLDINPRLPRDVRDNELPVSFLAMADVSEEGKVLTKHERTLGQVRKGFTYFGDGDVLFAKITPCMENGKGALVDELTNGIGFGSTEFHVLRPLDEADKWYCFHVSKMEVFRKEAEKMMTGSAGQRRVQTDFFNYYSLHLPTKEDRVKFGEVMNAYEQQKDDLKAFIEQTKQIKQQLINQIFSA